MTTATMKTNFADMYAKVTAEIRNNNHIGEVKRESSIFAEVKAQDKIDQHVIDTGARNGSPATRHGTSAEFKIIAEYNNKEIRAARLEGREPFLMQKSPETNGPHDMIITVNGVDVNFQSKYCKNTARSINHCIMHMNKYSEDYINGDGKYYIPKEQYELIANIKNGKVPEGMSQKAVVSIKRRIDAFEETKGDILESVRPGVTYEESQLENTEHVKLKREKEIKKQHKKEEEAIASKFNPNLRESLNAGLQAGAITGISTLVVSIVGGIFRGKNIFKGDYSKDELLDEAILAGKTATITAVVTTATHYAETLFRHSGTCLSAVGKLAFSIGPLLVAYEEGKISAIELKAGIYGMMLGLFVNAIVGAGIGVAVAALVAATMGIVPSLGALVLGVLGALAGMALGFILDKAYDYLTSIVNADIVQQQALHAQLIADMEAEYEKRYEVIRNKIASAFKLIERLDNRSLDIKQRFEALDGLSEHYGNVHTDTEVTVEKAKKFFFD